LLLIEHDHLLYEHGTGDDRIHLEEHERCGQRGRNAALLTGYGHFFGASDQKCLSGILIRLRA